ncbi:MAG TPA: protein-glutamate O-methyltransferase CheR [Capillimicrobium sp.]|nr:protein-glutamate O-methyltransferase CheR [Capillimicrobium sp.]
MALGFDHDPEALELELLLDGIYRRYGFDFRGYATASLRRRVWRRANLEGLDTITQLLDRVLHDQSVLERLMKDLSINVTEMFRDPSFHRALREKAFPLLRTYPFLRVWNAGCSTGEEAYSVAIALHEEGLLDRARIYATDMNESALAQARSGAFPLERMQDYTENYLRSGGTRSFSEYYVARGTSAVFDPELARNVVFAQHNLATDRSFNEFHVIICRNVMIYFGRDLQRHVHELFLDSLVPLGVLGLGRKEAIGPPEIAQRYEPLDPTEKLFRRRR